MDEQLKARFEQVLQHYADVIRDRDDTLLRDKKAREQFEASFRAAVDNGGLDNTCNLTLTTPTRPGR
jgi:hypothetical protein